MLQLQQCLNTDQNFLTDSENIYYKSVNHNENGEREREGSFSVLDCSSGLTHPFQRLPGLFLDDHCSLLKTKDCILCLDHKTQLHHCYNTIDGSVVTVNRKSRSNLTISTLCSSEVNDGMSFYASAEELSIYAVLFQAGHGTVSPRIRLDKLIQHNDSRCTGRIMHLCCHPSKQLLFIAYSAGAVQVLSYSEMYLRLKLTLKLDRNRRKSDTDTHHHQHQEEEGEEPTDGNEDRVDVGGDFDSSSHRRTNNPRVQQLLVPVAYCKTPTPQQIVELNADWTQHPLTIVQLRLDTRGALAGVLFGSPARKRGLVQGVLLCVFDISTLSVETSPRAPAAVRLLDLFGIFPCLCSEQDSAADRVAMASGVSQIDFKFSHFVFHPILPLVLVTVLRRERRTPKESSSHYFTSLAPTVCAVSLIRSGCTLLSSVGWHEFTELNSTQRKSTVPTLLSTATLDLHPTTVHCTPLSGSIAVAFNLYSSGIRGVNSLLWLMLRFSPHWVRSAGLRVHCQPLVSGVSVFPEVFLFGPRVMSQGSKISKKPPAITTVSTPSTSVGTSLADRLKSGASRLQEYVAVDGPVEKSSAAGNGLPLMLAIRAAPEQGSLFASPVSPSGTALRFHVFLLHYLFTPRGKEGEAAVGTNNTSSDSSASVSAEYAGSLPSVLTRASVDEGFQHASSWLQLGDSDHFPVPLPAESRLEKDKGVPVDLGAEFSFFPTEVKTLASLGTSVGGVFSRDESDKLWDAMIIGTVRRTVKTFSAALLKGAVGDSVDMNANYALQTQRCVSFIRKSSSGLSSVFTSFRDASYWKIPKDGVTGSEDTFGILVISENGRSISSIHTSGYIGAASIQSSWKLGGEVESVVAASGGINSNSASALMFVSAVGSSGDKQALYSITASTAPSIDHFSWVGRAAKDWRGATAGVFVIELIPGERVVAAEWQTQSLDRLLSPDQVELRQLLRGWMGTSRNSDSPSLLAGVLTTERILILDQGMQIINSVSHSDSSIPGTVSRFTSHSAVDSLLRCLTGGEEEEIKHQGAMNLMREEPVSFVWVGPALVYSCRSGALKFLLPTPPGDQKNMSDSSCCGVLCNLPRNLSVSVVGSQRAAMVLSDRLLLVSLQRDERTGLVRPHCTVRPVCPVEPLLLGLLALNTAEDASSLTTLEVDRLELIRGLVTCYFRPKSVSVIGGAYPSAHSTELLLHALQHKAMRALSYSVALAEAYAGLAMTVAGVPNDPNEAATSSTFPRFRWLSNELLLTAELEAGRTMSLCMTLFAGRAELQELCLQLLVEDGEAFGGTFLPAPGSSSSSSISAAAYLLLLQAASLHRRRRVPTGDDKKVRIQLQSLALRLADIAADYELVGAILRAARQDLGPLTSTLINTSRAECEELLSLTSSGDKISKSHVTLMSSLPKILFNSLNGSRRVPGSLNPPLSSTVLDGGNVFSEGSDDSRDFLRELEAAMKEHMVGKGLVGFGPAGGNGVLAMDLLEDLMGVNYDLETVVADAAAGFAGAAAGDELSPQRAEAELAFFGGALPRWWHEGVGQGAKEHELLMGYWRFSDVFYPREPGFFSCSEGMVGKSGGSRLVFSDLSRFEGPGLELFCETEESVAVEYSTSPADPGEQHENVKSLCDVVFLKPLETSTPSSTTTGDGAWASTTGGGFDDWGAFPATPTNGAEKKSSKESVSSTSGLIVRGMRCPVSRGSPLDVGLYHQGKQRGKFSAEIMLAVDPSQISFPSQSSQQASQRVLTILQRSSTEGVGLSVEKLVLQGKGTLDSFLWSLYVSGDGSVCFSFVTGTDKTSTAGSSVKTAPGLVKIHAEPTGEGDTTGEGLSGGSPWVHVALVMESKDSASTTGEDPRIVSSGQTLVTLFVNGVKEAHGALQPPSIPEESLRVTRLFVCPNFPAGARCTELRLWACSRSAEELEEQRLNFLALAMKKKRMQLRVKGAKKLFTQFRDIRLGPPSDKPSLPPQMLSDQENEKDTPNAAESDNTKNGFSRPPAIGIPTTAPMGTLGIAPKALSTAGLTAPEGKPLTARQRRMTAIRSSTAPPPSAGPVVLSAPAASTAVVTPRKSTAPALQPIAETPSKSNSHSSVDLALTEGNSGKATTEASRSWCTGLPSLSDSGSTVQANLFSSVSRCSPLSQLSWCVLCPGATRVDLTKLTSNAKSRSLVVTIPAASPDAVVESALLMLRRPQSSQSPTSSRGSLSLFGSHRAVLAVYQRRAIQVLDVTAAEVGGPCAPLLEIPMNTPLVYWRAITAELLLLITNTAGFSWRAATVTGADGVIQKPKPIKILDRVDIADTNRWSDRVVLDIQVLPDGWTLLVTRDKPSGLHSLVSLHHAKTGKALSFSAVGGRLRPAAPPRRAAQLLLIWSDVTTPATEAHLTLLEMTDVLSFASSKRIQNTTPDKKYIEPLHFSDISFAEEEQNECKIPAVWSLPVSDIPLNATENRPPMALPLSVFTVGDMAFLFADRATVFQCSLGSGGRPPRVVGRERLPLEGTEGVFAAELEVEGVEQGGPSVTVLVGPRGRVWRVSLKDLSLAVQAQNRS